MSDLHLAAQTTQKYGLPLSKLEYSYIEKCSDVKELEKILRVLRSGDEGRYPQLEDFAEKRLESLCPKSRVLRKDNPITKLGEIGSGDWQAIQQDLKEWSNDMHSKDTVKSGKAVKKGQEDFLEGDENLPPVRSSNVVLEGNNKKDVKGAKNSKKRVMPRDYKEWDKVDVDAELEKMDEAEGQKKNTSRQASTKEISDKIDATGLSEEEKERKANREKDKGNEAYRSGDFEESVTYYSRSISLLPTAASYNNRALAYLKLEKWDTAIKDCNIVLKLEKENVKALLRRGTAYKSKNQLSKGKTDFERVLELEPNNKKAESLLNDVNKLFKEESKSRKEKGRRMVIEEVESGDEEEVVEEIEVEKPMVNGHGGHGHDGVRENGIHQIPDREDDKTKQNSVNKKKGQKASKQQSSSLSPSSSSQGRKVSDKTSSVSSNSNKDTKEKMCSSQQQQQQQQKQRNMSGTNTTSPATPSLSEEKDNQKSSSAFQKGDGDVKTPPAAAAAAAAETTTLPSKKEDSTAALSSDKASLSSSLSSLSSSISSETADGAEQTPSSSSSPSPSQATTTSTVPSPSSSSSLSSSTAAADSSSSSSPSETSSPSFNRPVLIQLPLSTQVLKLKGEGNNLFRSGQYGSAIKFYSDAIALLEKERDQSVNISLILSNRSACHLKTGNCSQAVKDCARSLELVPHSLKSLLRRAAAFESLEIHGKAYVDYKHVLSIDRSVEQASQGASRCQKMLQDIHGQRVWRDKIPPLTLVQPWEVPLVVEEGTSLEALTAQTTQSKIESSPIQSNQVPSGRVEKEDSKSEKKETQQPSIEEEFERLKKSGNSHVQKGEYLEAGTCYTSCIALCPQQVACYTNRALCYIKMNKATEAETDCNKALSLQPDNPKALYRRALARKMLQRYKLSMQDLLELLKLEPKNKAAASEMEIVKKFYKEELEQLKQKKEADGKVRKRMKIEEVDDDEEDEKTVRSKAQTKSQSKSRGNKSNQQASITKSKGSNQVANEKKQSAGKDTTASSSSTPSSSVAPPSAPRLMKTTPYEFCQAWNSLKPIQGIQPYAEILRQISPADLPSVISNKLDGQMLQIIVRCVYEEMVLKGEVDKGYRILDNLCKVPRFSTVSMFLSSKEKKEVSSVLDILGKTVSSAYSKSDVIRLKKEYSVK